MVSAVELLYYLTVGLALYLYDNNYFKILKRHIHDLRLRWTIGLRNSLNEEYDVGASMKGKGSFVSKRPQTKNNRW